MATSSPNESQLKVQLKTKKICRFCLTQKEPLSNIYSAENRLKSRAPLPLQIITCTSIEVFTNDGMPSTICDTCRLLMDFSYRFKQMCKRADTALKQFPLTGVWPDKLFFPQYPEELIKLQSTTSTFAVSKSIKRELSTDETVDASKRQKLEPRTSPTKMVGKSPPMASSLPKTILVNRTQQQKMNVPVVKYVQVKNEFENGEIEFIEALPSPPKILNKNAKILNKNASQKYVEPKLCEPIIRTDEQGNVEIVTVFMENEPDPIKNALPVETNVFPCSYCERSFPLKQLLDIHVTNHTRERKFACDICKKLFFSKYDLSKHALIHSGEKPFNCVVCFKSFSRSTLLARHEKIHVEQPKHVCSYCDRKFLNEEDLDKHIERHKKNRPFSCKECGKSFAFKQGLERHEVNHQKDQPFQCEHCDKSFSTPNKLARHLTAHAGQRPFPCRLCPKSYLLSHHLTRHLRSHKEGEGSYKCSDCDKVFTIRDDLIYHSAIHATQNLTCPLCKKKFDDLDDVTDHIKSHTLSEQYACEFCDLIFNTEEELMDHSQEDHADEQAAYDEDDKSRKEQDYDEIDEVDYENDLFIEPIDEKPSLIQHLNDVKVDLSSEVEMSSETEEFSVKKSANLKVFKANADAKKLTSSTDLKKANTSPPKTMKKLPILTKVNVQNVPKGITITAKVIPASKYTEKKLESTSRSNVSPPVKSSEQNLVQKFVVLNTKSDKREATGAVAESTTSNNSLANRPKRGDLQKVKLTKAQVAAMAREGKIAVKDGQVFLRNVPHADSK